MFEIFLKAKLHGIKSTITIPYGSRPETTTQVTYRGAQGMLVDALKLVYKSSAVRGVSDVAYNSRWGCHGYSSFKGYPLNVVITDRQDNFIFPLQQFIKHCGTPCL